MTEWVRPEVVFTAEGGGHVATCTGCGWLRFDANRRDLGGYATRHRCRKDDPCLLCRRPVRIGGEGCPHYDAEGRRR